MSLEEEMLRNQWGKFNELHGDTLDPTLREVFLDYINTIMPGVFKDIGKGEVQLMDKE